MLLSITAIILISVSIFSNSWMTGVESDDYYGFDFGLTEFYSYEIGVERDSQQVEDHIRTLKTGVMKNKMLAVGLILQALLV